MIKVGLTGGIGSGKTTVARIFEVVGVPVYYADEAARQIMNTDEGLQAAIREQFGESSYRDGLLDRSYLAARVFNDPVQLEKLNSLVHPATLRDAASWMSKQQVPYTIKEAALIFESGAAEQLDYVIGVSAPLALRIDRTVTRGGVSHEEVMRRINSQLDETIKMKLCDFIIENDGMHALIPQVLNLHKHILQLAESIGN